MLDCLTEKQIRWFMDRKSGRRILQRIKAKSDAQAKKKAQINREWYSLRSILGENWAIFYFLLGGREAGKSYAVTQMFLNQWKKFKRPFTWLRLTDASQQKLLANNCEKLIDPDLKRAYNIDIERKGDGVFAISYEKKGKKQVKRSELMGRVLALSTFYNDKGSGLFDKDFLNDKQMYYNICLDEMNREKNERKSFDIVYAFTNQLENLVRSTKQRLRVICIGNTLEEASDILCAFNFIPEEFGRYRLRSRRAVIEYMEPTEAYIERRKGTVADILMPNASTFTNQIDVDTTLVTKQRLIRPSYIIKFDKDTRYTVWDHNIVAKWNGELGPCVSMRPYIDELYNVDRVNTVISLYDSRSYLFHNLITQKQFKKDLELLKPRK